VDHACDIITPAAWRLPLPSYSSLAAVHATASPVLSPLCCLVVWCFCQQMYGPSAGACLIGCGYHYVTPCPTTYPAAASSIIFDQAENRMHAQNGIMLHAMGMA
jgi:hypothetical protein